MEVHNDVTDLILQSLEIINTFKGITKFWYEVMNLFQINILEAYAILRYSVIVVAVEIES